VIRKREDACGRIFIFYFISEEEIEIGAIYSFKYFIFRDGVGFGFGF
jgi:hypothetical protein